MLRKADKTKMLFHIRDKLFNHPDTGPRIAVRGRLRRYDAIFLMDYPDLSEHRATPAIVTVNTKFFLHDLNYHS